MDLPTNCFGTCNFDCIGVCDCSEQPTHLPRLSNLYTRLKDPALSLDDVVSLQDKDNFRIQFADSESADYADSTDSNEDKIGVRKVDTETMGIQPKNTPSKSKSLKVRKAGLPPLLTPFPCCSAHYEN